MTDVIREMAYPEVPDTTPGEQFDTSISGIIRQNAHLQREVQLLRIGQDKIIANQQWVVDMVTMAMTALQQMPGMGAMMTKIMGAKKQ